jgi:predicted acylesterase/phospholipase RssA
MYEKTAKVLSLDGGGARGLITAVWLNKLVETWGIEPTELHKHFDVITGSSVGGIMSLGLSIGKQPSDFYKFFRTDAKHVFSTSSTTKSSRPSILRKIAVLTGLYSTFYPSDSDSNGSKYLYNTVKREFLKSDGTNMKMSDTQTNVVIPSFEKNDYELDFMKDTNTPVYFSNIQLGSDFIGQDLDIVDVAMSTSAAPLYFAPWQIGEDFYIDGGVVQNNPAHLGLSTAKAIKPTAKRYCLCSIGTGLGDVGFAERNAQALQRKVRKEIEHIAEDYAGYAETHNMTQEEAKKLRSVADNLKIMEGGRLLMYLIGAMTSGSQEVTAKTLDITSRHTLDNLHYYRMQYYLDPNLDTEMDNTSDDILDYYEESVSREFARDALKINNFIAHLEA